ncbi:Nn.00g037320.m01.CDS01 [Neocucurbitaria sp. VM-36]
MNDGTQGQRLPGARLSLFSFAIAREPVRTPQFGFLTLASLRDKAPLPMTRLLIAEPWSAGIRGSIPVVEMKCIARLLDHVLSRCLRTSARSLRQAHEADILPTNRIILWIKDYSAGFLIGPKAESKDVIPGACYHVKKTPFGWTYEEIPLENVRATNSLLARILIAKIEDEQRLIALLRQLPVVQGDPNWRCRTWVASALAEIAKDGKCVGTAELNWQKIEAFARQYVADKTASGRYRSAADMLEPKPTWDMLENKESVP